MKIVTLEEFGGKADGQFDNSEAFKNAVSFLADNNGGILKVCTGVWKTGPIDLLSNITLDIAEDAVISFISDPELYRPVYTRWEGVECYAMHPCIFSSNSKNVKITGKGTIDGCGSSWWALRQKKRTQKEPEMPIEKELASLNPDYKKQPGGGGGREVQFLRPPLVQFFNATNIIIEQVTLTNSPFWTLHPVYVDNLEIRELTIQNPHNAPNTDGIDIDSCSNVLIADSVVSVGDDGIALKSGSGLDGMRVNKPCHNIKVRNCIVGDGHGGIVIGSETAAGVHHVMAENCTFNRTDRGIRIKTRRGRGGHIHHLVFKNNTMRENLCPVAINMFYKCGAPEDDTNLFSLEPQPIVETTPQIYEVQIEGLISTSSRASAGFIAGLPESPIKNLSLKNCFFATDENSTISPQDSEMFLGIPETKVKSIRVLFCEKPDFENITVIGPETPTIFR